MIHLLIEAIDHGAVKIWRRKFKGEFTLLCPGRSYPGMVKSLDAGFFIGKTSKSHWVKTGGRGVCVDKIGIIAPALYAVN